MATPEMPIACLLGDGAEREARMRAVEELFRQARGVEEVEDGYVFRFDSADGIVERLAEFVVAEHRCCPFLTFDLRVGPSGTESVLRLSGDTEIKAFIGATFVV